jgi:hypothetical protein
VRTSLMFLYDTSTCQSSITQRTRDRVTQSPHIAALAAFTQPARGARCCCISPVLQTGVTC